MAWVTDLSESDLFYCGNLKSGNSCASTPRLPSGRGEISNKSRVTCAWCSYTFATSERYDNAVLFACHVLSKHRSDAKCLSEFKEMYEVDALKTHVPPLDFDASLTLSDVRNKPALVCAQCGVSCAIIHDLYKHSQKQHPELFPSTSSSSNTATPSRTGQSAVVKKEVKNSVTRHEKKSSRESSVSASSSSPENVFRIDLEAKNRCLQCHFAARTSVDLDLHIVMRHGGVKVEELASTSLDPDPEAVAEDSANTNSVSEEVAREKSKDDRMNGDKGEEQKSVHGDKVAGADSNDDDVTLMTLRKRTPTTKDTPTNEPIKNDGERRENVKTEDQMTRDADSNDKEMENDDVVTPSRRETRSAALARREAQTTKEKKRPRRSEGEEVQRKRARKRATVFTGGS